MHNRVEWEMNQCGRESVNIFVNQIILTVKP